MTHTKKSRRRQEKEAETLEARAHFLAFFAMTIGEAYKIPQADAMSFAAKYEGELLRGCLSSVLEFYRRKNTN